VFAGEGLLAEPIAGRQLRWRELVFMPRSGPSKRRCPISRQGRSKLLAAELRADLAQFAGRMDNRLAGIDGHISSIEGRLANLASAAQLL
jgi:hypothetical protein